MRTKTNSIPRQLSVIEVAILQSSDVSIPNRSRGAPILRTYATPDLLGMDVSLVGHQDFRATLAGYMAGRPSKDTGLRLIEDFNTLVRWATKKGYRTQPYVPFPSPPKRGFFPSLLDAKDMTSVIEATDRLFLDDLAIAIAIRSLAWLGLGVGETANFSFENIDFKRWEYIQKDGNGRLRLIPIPLPMRALIAKARHLTPEGGSCPRKRFNWLSDQTLRNIVQRIGIEIGVPGLLPIQIARTCLYGHPILERLTQSSGTKT